MNKGIYVKEINSYLTKEEYLSLIISNEGYYIKKLVAFASITIISNVLMNCINKISFSHNDEKTKDSNNAKLNEIENISQKVTK